MSAAGGEPASRRGRPAKVPLSRDSIAAAALELVAKRGAQAVKLADIARAVDTGPASLYVYFDGREGLMQHVLDAAYRQVRLPDPSAGPWRALLAEAIEATVDVLARYPGLALAALEAAPTLPGAFRIAEVELALLRRGGLDDRSAALAVDLIAQFAAAAALEQTHGRQQDEPEARARTRSAYASADAARYPTVQALAAALTGPDPAARRAFGLQVLLDGLEAAARDRG